MAMENTIMMIRTPWMKMEMQSWRSKVIQGEKLEKWTVMYPWVFMISIIWNCQGAGGRDFHRVLKHLIKVHKPNLVGLVEPKVSGSHANTICAGRIRGTLAPRDSLWKPGASHKETPLGGAPSHQKRDVRCLDGNAFGDFNAVTCQAETINYTAYSTQRSTDFVNWISSEGLIDLGFSGPRLTWFRGTEESSAKEARLDRALCTVEWRQRFPDASVQHLPRICSDHAPLLIRLDTGSRRGSSAHFKLQAAWLADGGFRDVVIQAWNPARSMPESVKAVQTELTAWNKDVFGSIAVRKKILLARIGGIQRLMAESIHRGLYKLEKKLKADLEDVLYQEELLWFQRSREEWIVSGDRNTKFYHAATMVRRARN
ncbi:PREDICTED: uncharacterized protein LOC109157057 [Ipomoea nil]|uniref:uncharacterized protein LOC109157057 n=1 Tax=Ipomoea nil TaxID=35883 RepID=UPI000900B96D|nr:PREDICTED: uncharacterized protein LOC109157057 [Ipomoea nil]